MTPCMNAEEFLVQLASYGYAEVRHRHFERGEDSQPHSHDFDTRLLVQQGELTIVWGEIARTYQAGEILEIPAGQLHCERYAQAPVRFIAGLRHRPA